MCEFSVITSPPLHPISLLALNTIQAFPTLITKFLTLEFQNVRISMANGRVGSVGNSRKPVWASIYNQFWPYKEGSVFLRCFRGAMKGVKMFALIQSGNCPEKNCFFLCIARTMRNRFPFLKTLQCHTETKNYILKVDNIILRSKLCFLFKSHISYQRYWKNYIFSYFPSPHHF